MWGGNYLKSKADFEAAGAAKEFMERFYNNKKARLPMKIISRITGQGARMQTAPMEVLESSRFIDVLLLDNNKQQQIVIAHRFLLGLREEIESWEVLEELRSANAAFADAGFDFGSDDVQAPGFTSPVSCKLDGREAAAAAAAAIGGGFAIFSSFLAARLASDISSSLRNLKAGLRSSFIDESSTSS